MVTDTDQPYPHRLDAARRAATEGGTDAILVTPGPDLKYLAGAGGASHERLTCLVLRADREPVLVVPRLERPGLDATPIPGLGIEIIDWTDNDDPYAAIAKVLGGATKVAVADGMTASHVLRLREAMPAAEQVLASPLLRRLRMCKDAHERDALTRAGAAIDRVHARMGEWLKPGRTEAEVGADITAAIVEEGHTEAAFVIVGSGPNGASPHHDVSERVIARGDVVVVDIGGPLPDGYYSDCTRTYSLGMPVEPDVADTYAVLQAAQDAAVAVVAPGVRAHDVDAAAREPITAAGFGDRFIHRTGHGIGLEVHEEPYMVAGNDLTLEPGMAFSIEPGIYLPGRWGARIEDIVLVTEDGAARLNHQPRALHVLDA